MVLTLCYQRAFDIDLCKLYSMYGAWTCARLSKRADVQLVHCSTVHTSIYIYFSCSWLHPERLVTPEMTFAPSCASRVCSIGKPHRCTIRAAELVHEAPWTVLEGTVGSWRACGGFVVLRSQLHKLREVMSDRLLPILQQMKDTFSTMCVDISPGDYLCPEHTCFLSDAFVWPSPSLISPAYVCLHIFVVITFTHLACVYGLHQDS